MNDFEVVAVLLYDANMGFAQSHVKGTDFIEDFNTELYDTERFSICVEILENQKIEVCIYDKEQKTTHIKFIYNGKYLIWK